MLIATLLHVSMGWGVGIPIQYSVDSRQSQMIDTASSANSRHDLDIHFPQHIAENTKVIILIPCMLCIVSLVLVPARMYIWHMVSLRDLEWLPGV